jgi:hypothetical protein
LHPAQTAAGSGLIKGKDTVTLRKQLQLEMREMCRYLKRVVDVTTPSVARSIWGQHLLDKGMQVRLASLCIDVFSARLVDNTQAPHPACRCS